jgi:hypothetical protein
MLDGKLTLESFTDVMAAPTIRELIKKVRRYRIASDKVYSGVVGYTDIAIDTARGRFEMRVDRSPGSPAWPMTEQDRIENLGLRRTRARRPAARDFSGWRPVARRCATSARGCAALIPAASKSTAPRGLPQTRALRASITRA